MQEGQNYSFGYESLQSGFAAAFGNSKRTSEDSLLWTVAEQSLVSQLSKARFMRAHKLNKKTPYLASSGLKNYTGG